MKFIPFDNKVAECKGGNTLIITWVREAKNQWGEVVDTCVTKIKHLVAKDGIATGIDDEGVVIWKGRNNNGNIVSKIVVKPFLESTLDEIWLGNLIDTHSLV